LSIGAILTILAGLPVRSRWALLANWPLETHRSALTWIALLALHTLLSILAFSALLPWLAFLAWYTRIAFVALLALLAFVRILAIRPCHRVVVSTSRRGRRSSNLS
jgi:hypothetical protein